MPRVTTIKVPGGEEWEVPFGFGRTYRDEAERQDSAQAESIVEDIQTMLGLIGYEASGETILKWSFRKRVELIVYAANSHIRASDNPVPRHPKLDWLPEPYRGPERGEGTFQGPGPTMLTA